MLIPPNPNTPDIQPGNDLSLCAALITDGRLLEAWTLMEAIPGETILLLFNKALCLIETRNYAQAIPLLERAFTLLTPQKTGITPSTSPEAEAMRQKQNNKDTHRQPVTPRYAELFPHLLKDSVLRLMVDCYLALGNTAKVIEIATPLKSKGYRNILEALNKTL